MRRAEADAARMRKERAWVVRFLARGPAAARRAGGADRVPLDSGERGTIAVCAGTLAALGRDDVVRRQGATLSLSPQGEALARRAENEDEPFRAQHMELGSLVVPTAAGPEAVQANLSESPLAQLARRRTRGGQPFLDEAEFRAGERLRADYTRGQIMPRLGANWDAAVASGRRGSDNGIADLTDAALAARRRVDAAVAAVGPELAGVLVDICCFLKGLERVEAERGWPIRSAKVVLKAALSALARHYEPKAPTRRRTVLHWGTADYRPSLRAKS